MLARVETFAVDGITAQRVEVEADIRGGLPAFTVVGLADKAVREARERVRSAIINSGFKFPESRITVNLAPAYLRKIGPGFDLPLALALLVAAGQLDPSALQRCAAVGELSLTGELRPVRGALAMAEAAVRIGASRLLIPRSRAREAAIIDGIEVLGVASLPEAVAVLRGDADCPPPPAEPARSDAGPPELDLADVRGHDDLLVLALEVAAAGGHNLFMHGPPGTGKTMIARRLPTILPPLTPVEAIEVTRIQSVAGLHGQGGLVSERPFRSPHHSISASGLVGGGTTPLPGEATLAHNGVLFLDELSEFSRSALEALRQPLEDGDVVIVRSQRVVRYPSRCMLVAASNPCPCGAGGDRCRCSAADIARHERKLSGPLLDRIDVQAYVGRPSARALATWSAPRSELVREQVVAARRRQAERFAGTSVVCNAHMTPRMLDELVAATLPARKLLDAVHDDRALSARGYARVLRVARTVADLEGAARVEPDHVHQAVSLRTSAPAEAFAA